MAQTQARRRISKHQLKEDSFITAVFSAREWVEGNLRTVLLAVGGVIAVVAITWGIANYTQSRDADASALFGQAGVEMRSNNLSAAIINFQRVLDEYGGSDAADLACFQLADAHYRQRSFDDARAAYQRYLDDYGDDDMLVASAWAGLAAIDEHANDLAAAAEKNMKAAALDSKSFQGAEYLRHAMRCAIAAKDSALALRAFAMLEESGADQRNLKIARQTLVEHRLLAPTAP